MLVRAVGPHRDHRPSRAGDRAAAGASGIGDEEGILPVSFEHESSPLLSPAGGTTVAEYAESLRRIGRPDDALRWLRVWLERSNEMHAWFWDAESQRLEGEIRLAQDPAARSGAESCFERALSISRTQEARSLELRAATSLARLWMAQGRRDEARALLEPVWDGFTEGFDTADLKDGRAMLDEL